MVSLAIDKTRQHTKKGWPKTGSAQSTWQDKWKSNPTTSASYDSKAEYIKHLEEKYESLR